jgi:thioredoxin reductase (NADPH)
VTIVHRRDEFRASKIMVDRARRNPKIDWALFKEVVEVLSHPGQKKVRAAVLRDTRSGETSEFEVDGVFVAIGHQPNSMVFADQVETDAQGYVKVRNGTYTSVEGVFACGDLTDKTYRQAVTAAGTGCMAAIDAERWLEALHHH